MNKTQQQHWEMFKKRHTAETILAGQITEEQFIEAYCARPKHAPSSAKGHIKWLKKYFLQ